VNRQFQRALIIVPRNADARGGVLAGRRSRVRRAAARLSAAGPELTERRRAVAELIAAIEAEPEAPSTPTLLEPVLHAAVAGVGDAAEVGARFELPRCT
jgi:hypothetical protein